MSGFVKLRVGTRKGINDSVIWDSEISKDDLGCVAKELLVYRDTNVSDCYFRTWGEREKSSITTCEGGIKVWQ